MQHLLAGEEEVRDLLPFQLSPEPIKAEMELSMTSARGDQSAPSWSVKPQ